MAKYFGKFTCGCEGYANVIGPQRDRQWKIDRAFNNMCEDCYRKHLEEEREKANKKALEKSVEMELPTLEGTEKQVAWANTLRCKILEELSEFREGIMNNDTDDIDDIRLAFDIKKRKYSEEELKSILLDYLFKFETLFINNVKASYFTNNRSKDLEDYLESEAENIINAEKIRKEKELHLQIIKETTVEPKELKFDDVVEIIADKEIIKLSYEKNETFINIVKSLGYEWKNNYWQRAIKETTGSYIDRSAEVANKLLNAGFRVAIPEIEMKEKALNGTYEHECKRWIFHRKDTTKMAANWQGYNDKLYSASKNLKGARWDSPSMIVDAKHFEQIEEFAEMYGFKFTKASRNFLDKYKVEYEKQMNSIEKVNVKEVEKVAEKNGLEDILNSSREVLEDLVEED